MGVELEFYSLIINSVFRTFNIKYGIEEFFFRIIKKNGLSKNSFLGWGISIFPVESTPHKAISFKEMPHLSRLKDID